MESLFASFVCCWFGEDVAANPNLKLQTSNFREASNFKFQTGRRRVLNFGAWSFPEVWSLKFEVFVWLFLLLPISLLHAQQPPAPHPQDPFISLMMSQPRLEVSTQITATASFDPPVIKPGELSVYRVTFNALEQSIEWTDDVFSQPKLNLRPGAHGMILQMTGAGMEPRTTFNYRVRPSATGEFSVPLFMVTANGREVAVPPAQLEVTLSPSNAPAAASELRLEIPTTNLWVGQAVNVRVLFPGSPSGMAQGLAQVQFTGEGLVADLTAAHQTIERMVVDGVNLPVFIYETSLSSIAAGKLSVFAQGFSAGMRFSGPIVIRGSISGSTLIPGGMPQYTLLDSDPLALQVRPVPSDGQLPGFTGAIGTFTLEPVPKLSTNVLRAGESLKLTVSIANRGGSASLARLVAPPAPHLTDWRIFPAAPEAAPAPDHVAFSYTLVPLTEKASATPGIPFSYFDPEHTNYVDLTIPPQPITIQPGANAADLKLLRDLNAASGEPEKEPALSTLASAPGISSSSLTPLQQRAWFLLLQVAIGAAFFGVWSWDRRRRYLEQHPEIIRRRRALRALRRERRVLRRAALSGDAPRFATAAVSAMRVACAPHFPAEPRAMVGSDVLQLLDNSAANFSARAAEVVRRFFSVTDASQFGNRADSQDRMQKAPDTAHLLPLQNDLERVLQILEEKL
jgi:hypothetical protein